ncbi:MAG: gamma-glutamylcyclotransferase family protein [Chloroflexota bacterium]
MKRLFIYGTLMLDDVQQRIIGREVPMTPATLQGYRKGRVTVEGKTYPRITADEAASVDGMVIELDDTEMQRVDAYEGSEYVRIVVVLGDGTEAWVYAEPLSDD